MNKNFRNTIWILLCMMLFSTAVFADSGASAADEPRKKLIVGDDINYPPYSYVDSNGKPAGFNVELARFVGNAMGYDVEIRLEEWSKVRSDLEAGRIDAVSGMFYSKERAKNYLFTSRHSVATGDIFAREGVSVKNLSDLNGKTMVVQDGDIVGEFLEAQHLGIRMVKVFTVEQALQMVSEGKYDYAGLSKLPGEYTMQEHGIRGVTAQGLSLAPHDYCMAVKPGNESLMMALNGGLQVAKATGDYQKIYDKWLGVYEVKDFQTAIRPYLWTIYGVVGFVVFLIFWGVILKGQVAARTKELRKANEELLAQREELTAVNEEMEASLEELMAIEEELRDQYERLSERERELRESREMTQAIVRALPDIVFVLDGEGRFVDCQTGNEEELLLPKEFFIGKYMTEVLPPEVAQEGLDNIRQALRTGALQRMEYQLPLPGGEQVFELRIVKSHDNEVIGITRNITEQRQRQVQVEYLSYHDQLTGLYNRRFFEQELARLNTPENLPLCIVMADVNGLKLVNDSFGHQAGDQLLVKVSEVLKDACRSGEIISRIGGDEFVILLPCMDGEAAENLIRRIKTVSDTVTVASVELSISFGWEIKTEVDQDVYEIFNRAEDYMYKKKLFEGPSMRGKTVGAIIRTLHEKNKREEQHSQRVSELCQRMAVMLGMSDRELGEMRSAGLLHDIGKIAIHEHLLNKPGKLTAEEYEEVKRHPEIGYRILSSVNDMAELADFVLYHHERWDGGGYPQGVCGEQIPLQSRIIAVADAYDAMTSERSYRAPMTEAAAREELLNGAETQFDPVLVRRFVAEVLDADSVSAESAL